MTTEIKNLTTSELEAIVKSLRFIDKVYLKDIYNELINRNSNGLDDWTNSIEKVKEYI